MNESILSNISSDLLSLDKENGNEYKDCIVFDDIPEYDTQDYDIFDDKDFKKYIGDIEKICRTSFEYRQFVNYLREYMNMNKCSFFSNVTNSESFKIKIHLHHCPFTLYDICMTVFNKRNFYGESLEVEMVAKEVMYIHYFLMVGIIPLAETVHELVHSQMIFIPIDNVLGNYSEFIDIYKEFIPEEAMEKFEAMTQQTLTYNNAVNSNILQIDPIVIKLSGDEDGNGTYALPHMEQIVSLMKNRVQEIKDNGYQLPSYVEDNSKEILDAEYTDVTLEDAFGYV